MLKRLVVLSARDLRPLGEVDDARAPLLAAGTVFSDSCGGREGVLRLAYVIKSSLAFLTAASNSEAASRTILALSSQLSRCCGCDPRPGDGADVKPTPPSAP